MSVRPRPLAWTARSPVQIAVTATSPAEPLAVFEVLADHDAWPQWFASVRRVEVTGSAAGVGARRRVHAAGMTIDEEFVAWSPGERWAFTATSVRPAWTRALLEDCRLAPTPTGGTSITYTMHLDPHPLVRPVVALATPFIRRQLAGAAAALADRATRTG